MIPSLDISLTFHVNQTSIGDFLKAVDTTTDDAGDSKKPLMVLDCYATWCPPCKAIAPKFEEYSNKYDQAAFYKVNVDEVPDVAHELGIRSMPTFAYFKNGEKVNEVLGAAPPMIEGAIAQHIS